MILTSILGLNKLFIKLLRANSSWRGIWRETARDAKEMYSYFTCFGIYKRGISLSLSVIVGIPCTPVLLIVAVTLLLLGVAPTLVLLRWISLLVVLVVSTISSLILWWWVLWWLMWWTTTSATAAVLWWIMLLLLLLRRLLVVIPAATTSTGVLVVVAVVVLWHVAASVLVGVARRRLVALVSASCRLAPLLATAITAQSAISVITLTTIYY